MKTIEQIFAKPKPPVKAPKPKPVPLLREPKKRPPRKPRHIVMGKTCHRCGKQRRFSDDRTCVTCYEWEANYVLARAEDHSNSEFMDAILKLAVLESDANAIASAQRGRQTRRARKMAAPGRVSKAYLRRLLILQGYRCAYCDASGHLHLDHIVPLAAGGSNWPWNFQWLCAHHNSTKQAREEMGYRARLGIYDEPLTYKLWRPIFAGMMIPPQFDVYTTELDR